MKYQRYIQFGGLLFLLLGLLTLEAQKRVLHLSFHKGCINDFQEVADVLGLEVVVWFIPELPPTFFDGTSQGNALYNIGHDRAQRIWELHHHYFNSFDLIVTSDTAPLSRIFLQNAYKGPLIIWICNRFDYYDAASLDCEFPDSEYYELMCQAIKKKQVKIISYTPYEYFYASLKGVDIGTCTIKPIGLHKSGGFNFSLIPADIIKQQTLFIPPYLNQEQKEFVVDSCSSYGISVYCGRYNGPNDLQGFKGILHFPYSWSNLALFENIQKGLIYFVPSLSFVKQLVQQGFPVRFIAHNYSEWAEWYREENKDLFVYFDSWDDLQRKVATLDYIEKQKCIIEFAVQHQATMIGYWKRECEELLG